MIMFEHEHNFSLVEWTSDQRLGSRRSVSLRVESLKKQQIYFTCLGIVRTIQHSIKVSTACMFCKLGNLFLVI